MSLLKARNRFRKVPGTSDVPTGLKGRRDFRLWGVSRPAVIGSAGILPVNIPTILHMHLCRALAVPTGPLKSIRETCRMEARSPQREYRPIAASIQACRRSRVSNDWPRYSPRLRTDVSAGQDLVMTVEAFGSIPAALEWDRS